MKECFRGEGDKGEQALYRSGVLAVHENKEEVLAGSHRFHHASVGSADCFY